MKLSAMQIRILKQTGVARTASRLAELLGSYPGPVTRSIRPLVDNGLAEELAGGKFRRTEPGKSALNAAV